MKFPDSIENQRKYLTRSHVSCRKRKVSLSKFHFFTYCSSKKCKQMPNLSSFPTLWWIFITFYQTCGDNYILWAVEQGICSCWAQHETLKIKAQHHCKVSWFPPNPLSRLCVTFLSTAWVIKFEPIVWPRMFIIFQTWYFDLPYIPGTRKLDHLYSNSCEK